MEQSLYLMLDSKGTPIARGRVQGGTGGQYWQIQVEDGKIDEILEHKKLKLLSVMDTGPSYEGVIVRSRNDMIQLEVTRINADAHDMRKNLRVVVHFNSFIYPLGAKWAGRRQVESNDLSAGGIAFFTDHSLQVGEQVEVVIPVTGDDAAGGGFQPTAAGAAQGRRAGGLSGGRRHMERTGVCRGRAGKERSHS